MLLQSLFWVWNLEGKLELIDCFLGTVTKYGHYNPWLFFGTATLAIAGGIFSTFKVHTGDPLINGIQVLCGLGSACVIQMVCLHIPDPPKSFKPFIILAPHRPDVHPASKRHSNRHLHLSLLSIFWWRNLPCHWREHLCLSSGVRLAYVCTDFGCLDRCCRWGRGIEESGCCGGSKCFGSCTSCLRYRYHKHILSLRCGVLYGLSICVWSRVEECQRCSAGLKGRQLQRREVRWQENDKNMSEYMRTNVPHSIYPIYDASNKESNVVRTKSHVRLNYIRRLFSHCIQRAGQMSTNLEWQD